MCMLNIDRGVQHFCSVARELPSDGGGGAHHNRDQPRVPSHPVFSPVLDHLFFPLGLFNEKNKQTNETFADKWGISSQLTEESMYLCGSIKYRFICQMNCGANERESFFNKIFPSI